MSNELRIVSVRTIAAPPDRVFGAFRDAERLQRWWGPKGFTNEFDVFDFRPGGTWQYTMRGPDGTAYPNESRFVDIDDPVRIELDHLRPMHWFRLSMTFEKAGAGTQLSWTMRFEDEREELRPILEQANEENFDRLEAELNREST